MPAVKKVKKRRLNVKALILLLLIVYVIVMILYTFFTMPIKNIYINNTSLIKDVEIIEAAGIKDYPSIFKVNKNKMRENIKNIELVSDVNIKKTLRGEIIIDVEEAVPLFYIRRNNKVALSDGRQIDSNNKYLGIPALINYVPTDLLDSFINSWKNIDTDIIKMINEIEYAPDIRDDVVIDDKRFLLRMNDTNLVYVNVINMKRLNDYKRIYAAISSSLGDKKGTLLLDSYVSDNNLLGLFTAFTDSTGDGNTDGKDKLPE